MLRLTCVLSVCFIAATLADAQTGKIQKEVQKALEEKKLADESLAKLLAEALKNNPDLRVAETRLRDAEAELARTRLKVVSEITQLHAEIRAAQAWVDHYKKQVDRLVELHALKSIEERLVDEARLKYEAARADLAVKQAKLPYLLGKQAGALDIDDILRKKWLEPAKESAALSDDEFLRRTTLDVLGRLPLDPERDKFMSLDPKQRRQQWIDHLLQVDSLPPRPKHPDYVRNRALEYLLSMQVKVDSPMVERLRKVLDTPVTITGDVAAKDLMDLARAKLSGINLQERFKSPKDGVRVDINTSIPLGAFLQLVEEELHCVFVLRDYGIVVVAADEKLPPGALKVVEFWKHGKTPPDPLSAPAEKKKVETPPVEKRGKVESIDPKDPTIVMLSIGADAGVKAGQMLDVFRTGPQAKYLGSIRIASATAQKSIGRLASFPGGGVVPVLQVGDEVGTIAPK